VRLAHAACVVLSVFATSATVRADAADDYVARWLAMFKVPGVAIAVVKDGQVVKMQGYGFANRETREPVTTDTVFKIGSVSKQFIASAVMRLVRDRRLTLDDPVRPYFDDLPASWQPITVRQLLSHTAGLPRESPVFDGMKRAPDIEIIRGAYRVPLLSPPGDKYAYSNVGYYVLSELIARVTREPWADYVTDAVFRPAGLAPVFTTGARNVRKRARGYSGNDNSDIAAEWIALRPSGAFMTTISQLAKWEAVLRTDRVLTAAERQLMATGVTLNDGTSAPYGFGWHVERFNGERYIWHGGGLPGFSSNFARFPDAGVTVIALANGDDSDMGSLTTNLALMQLPARGQ
jgi:CubicO group peptidase (beta-lactamase class C family)